MFGSVVLFALFCQVRTEDGKPLMLLGQLNNEQLELRCVTKDVDKATVWNTPIGQNFIPTDVKYSDSKKLTPNSWITESSLQNNLGLLLDERWEDLSTIYTNGLEFQKLVGTDSSSNYIPISVRLKAEGHIYICRKQGGCYWIILGGWSGKKSVIRKCAKEEIKFESTRNCRRNAQNFTTKLNENEWKHFTVVLDNKNKSVSVIFDGEDTPFLYYQDDKMIDGVTEVYVNSKLGFPGFWKLHNYQVHVLRDQEKNKEHLLFSLYPPANFLRFSMYAAFCDTCTIVLTLKNNQSNIISYEISTKKGAWRKIKFYSALRLNKQLEYSLHVKVRGELKDSDQIVLSNIKQHTAADWFENGETKYSTLRINQKDYNKVSCQYLLSDPKDKETAVIKLQEPSLLPENPCKPPDTIGSICISCAFTFNQNQCEKTIICENLGCYCSQGYEGSLCQFALPQVVDVTWNSSDTTISLEWKESVEAYGRIIVYKVSYEHTSYKSSHCVKDNDSLGEITTTNTKIVLENLNSDSNYVVRIIGSSKFKGEMVETQVSTKLDDELDKDAFEISITEYDMKIELHFKPNCKKIKGPIKIGLILTYSQFGNNNYKSTNLTIDPFNRSNSLIELNAFTEYHLKFIAFNSVRSIDLFTKTLKTKPGISYPVTNFEVYEKSETSLLVRWNPPEPPTGIIEQYLIFVQHYWKRYGESHGEIKTNNTYRCKVWSNMICAELKGLTKGLKYRIKITAKNENVNLWSDSVTTNAITEVDAPESPRILGAMWDNGFNLTLRWQHPDKTNGRLVSFVIKRNSEEFFHFKVTGYNLTYEITQALYPESPSYTFEMYAANTNFASALSTILVRNPPRQPKIIGSISHKEHINNTIKMFIPAPIDVQYKSFTYVIVSEPGLKDCKQSRSVLQFIGNYKECKVWFAKEIKHQDKQEEVIIGDTSTRYSNYLSEPIINRALKITTKYNIFVVVVNENNNFKRFSVSKDLLIVIKAVKVVLPCYTKCELRFNSKHYSGSTPYLAKIKYKELNQTSWNTTDPILLTNSSIFLDVFKKTTNYTLRIHVSKGPFDAEEKQIPEISFATSCRNVQLENINILPSNTSVLIYLKDGFEEEICNLDQYNLTVTIPGYNVTLRPWHLIENLEPWTTYDVTIFSKTHNLLTNFTTDEGTPGTLSNITWSSSATTVSLEWKAPTKPNGKIIGYTVIYEHDVYKSCPYSRTIDSPSGKNKTKIAKIVLENLNPNSNYSVWIGAFTKFPGEMVQTEVSTKPSNELDKDAYQISINEYETMIGLHFWPNCKKINGPALIAVKITCSQFWCNKTTNLTIDPHLFSYPLRNLHAFTQYHLEFSLLNSEEKIGLFAKSVTTKPGIPGPVRYFEVYERSDSSLLLRWKLPEPPTGLIETFLISAKYYYLGVWVDSTITTNITYTCKFWSDMICAELKDVTKGVKYLIAITAKHENVDTWSDFVTTEVAVN